MGRAAPLDRDLVFTDASLTVAASRHSGVALVPKVEAMRILRAHPASGVSVSELTQWIAERISPIDPMLSAIRIDQKAAGKDANGSLDLPCEGSGGE
jgi:hypothetical protein